MSETRENAEHPLESLDEYRERFRGWAEENLDRRSPDNPWNPIHDDDGRASKNRELLRRLFDAGYSGICYPRDYGGQGLPREYQAVVSAELADFDCPSLFSAPTFSITGPTVLEFGTEAQKQRYIPGWLKGDELWVQFISEPSGGSDMAGALTRADRDGDNFIVNGSKVWSTYAYRADYGLMLARTNWDVPKHRGLTMFIVPIDSPGIEIQQVRMVDGSDEFCQEFFTDLVLTEDHVLGEVDDGWTVALGLLVNERALVGGTSAYSFGPRAPSNESRPEEMVKLALANGWKGDRYGRQLVGRAEELHVVGALLNERIASGVESGHFEGPAGSIARLFSGVAGTELATIALELAGDPALVWSEGERTGRHGIGYVQRQVSCLGGGSTEMARNLISERLLGMPREPSPDRGVPFRDVPRNG